MKMLYYKTKEPGIDPSADRDYRHMTDKTCKLCGPSLAVRHDGRIRVLALHPHVYRSHDDLRAPNIFLDLIRITLTDEATFIIDRALIRWPIKVDVPMEVSPFRISRASQGS